MSRGESYLREWVHWALVNICTQNIYAIHRLK